MAHPATSPLIRIAAMASLVVLAGCSEFYSMAPRTTLKTVGNLSIVSAGMVMATDKTLSDHIVSYRTGKDCSTVRSEQGRTYCREDEPNPISNLHCYQTLGDVMCYAKPDPSRQPIDALGNLRQEPAAQPDAQPAG